MLRIVLIRPGSTDFDEQGRIKGTLDIPLSEKGAGQVKKTVQELSKLDISTVYAAPSESAEKTAQALAESQGAKLKIIDKLQNLDHGLWHGKLIEEVKHNQPKVYRQAQDHPETVCPPDGESLDSARVRLNSVLSKIFKKHKSGIVAIVVPEPLASLVHSVLNDSQLEDLWKTECDSCRWELLDVQPQKMASR